MRNFILSVLSGVLLYFSWPSQGFPLLLFIAFVPILLVEYHITNSPCKRKHIKVFAWSYLSFFIWNFFVSWWLHYSSVGGALMAIFANTLLMSLVFISYRYIKNKLGYKLGLIFLVCFWFTFEKLHLEWEVAWPWLNLGNAFAHFSNWVQWYEYTGIFGGSLWIWIVNIMIFKSILKFYDTRQKSFIFRALFKSFLVVIIPIIGSYTLLNNYKEKGKDVNVVIAQPNLDPYTDKYKYTDHQIANRIINLVEDKIDNNTHFIVTPETTFHGSIDVNTLAQYPAIQRLKYLLKPYPKLNFLVGITSIKKYYSILEATYTARKHQNFWYDVYNSVIQINQTDNIPIYHKSKLVTGVEIMPYKRIFAPLLGEIALDLGGSTGTLGSQKEREVFTNPYYLFKTAPIVCYESVFGQYVTEYVKRGAGLLTIITNDGWWSTSDGHRQHLAYAKLRAIETRRSIVRSANTGVSAFINQKGEITKFLGYAQKGAIKGTVKYHTTSTFYTQYGDYIARVGLFLATTLFIFAICRSILLKGNRLKK